MTDLELRIQDDGIDLVLEGGDLAADQTWKTAALASVFTDARAEEGDELPCPEDPDPRGFWADRDADRWGSKLWLLERAKALTATANAAREYAIEAFDWMARDRIARDVDASASFTAAKLSIEIRLEPGPAPLFAEVWAATLDESFATDLLDLRLIVP